jgi:hypothetical protein
MTPGADSISLGGDPSKPTSGTYLWFPSVEEIIDEAAERARINTRSLTVDQQFSARRSLNSILMDWTVKRVGQEYSRTVTISLTQGQATYPLANEVIDILLASYTRDGVDTPIVPMNYETYLNIPKKDTQGRPQQYFVERHLPGATITLWQVPDRTGDTLTIRVLRYPQDVRADMTWTVEQAKYYMDALIGELAHRLYMKWGGDYVIGPDGKVVTNAAGEELRTPNMGFANTLKGLALAAFEEARKEDASRSETRMSISWCRC